MNVRFIGCLHLGHKWMAQHRGFQDEFYHDENLIDTWNSVVNPKDITYILGDITMQKEEPYQLLDRLNGRKIVVLGNHDLPKHTRKLLEHVDSVAGMIKYKGSCLTHAPIHPSEIGFYSINLHCHIHHLNKLMEVEASDSYKDPGFQVVPTLHKYVNVDAKVLNFKPISLDEALGISFTQEKQMEIEREQLIKSILQDLRTL